MDWETLLSSDGFAAPDMLQTDTREDGVRVEMTRAPPTLDGRRPRGHSAAPQVGAQSATIRKELNL